MDENERESNCDVRTVESSQTKAVEVFCIGGMEVSKNTQSHCLSKLQPFNAIRPPVHSSCVAPQGNSGRQFVQFSANDQV